MAVLFHYSKEYYKARRFALIFGIAGLVLSGPLALSFLFIAFYNSTCASVPSKEFSCDGSTCDCGCSALTPSTSPELFTFLFIWLAAVIVLVILAIINIAKAKAVKVPIPYTPAELAQMEWQRIEREQRRQASMIYIPAYYTFRKRQIIFSILAGVSGFVIFSCFLEVCNHLLNRAAYGEYWRNESEGVEAIVYGIWGVIHIAALVIFLILVVKNVKLKKQFMIRKQPQTMTNPYQPFVNQVPINTQSPYIQNPYISVMNNQVDYSVEQLVQNNPVIDDVEQMVQNNSEE